MRQDIAVRIGIVLQSRDLHLSGECAVRRVGTQPELRHTRAVILPPEIVVGVAAVCRIHVVVVLHHGQAVKAVLPGGNQPAAVIIAVVGRQLCKLGLRPCAGCRFVPENCGAVVQQEYAVCCLYSARDPAKLFRRREPFGFDMIRQGILRKRRDIAVRIGLYGRLLDSSRVGFWYALTAAQQERCRCQERGDVFVFHFHSSRSMMV